MNTYLRFCVSILLVQLLLVGTSHATSISKSGFESCITGNKVKWDGGGDGESWFDAANWSDDTLPADGDSVSIKVNGQQTIRFDSPLFSVRILCLDSNQALLVAGGTLEIMERGTVSPLITLDGGTLIASGSLQVLASP